MHKYINKNNTKSAVLLRRATLTSFALTILSWLLRKTADRHGSVMLLQTLLMVAHVKLKFSC